MQNYLKEIKKQGYHIEDRRKLKIGFDIIKQPHFFVKLIVVGMRFGITTTAAVRLFGRESIDSYDSAFKEINTIATNLNYLIEQERIKEEENESSK